MSEAKFAYVMKTAQGSVLFDDFEALKAHLAISLSASLDEWENGAKKWNEEFSPGFSVNRLLLQSKAVSEKFGVVTVEEINKPKVGK